MKEKKIERENEVRKELKKEIMGTARYFIIEKRKNEQSKAGRNMWMKEKWIYKRFKEVN